jgi:hypothetical protein
MCKKKPCEICNEKACHMIQKYTLYGMKHLVCDKSMLYTNTINDINMQYMICAINHIIIIIIYLFVLIS